MDVEVHEPAKEPKSPKRPRKRSLDEGPMDEISVVDEGVSSSNSDNDLSPNQPKRSKLLPRMDREAFDALYYRQHPSKFEPKKKITKIFSKQTAPGWLDKLGEPRLNDNRKWDLQMPECLIAHVAGHKPASPEFNVSTNVDLLAEIFDLASYDRIPTAPSFNRFKPSLALWYSTLRNQFKLFTLSWAQARVTYEKHWEEADYMENVVIPTLSASIESIKSTVLLGRQMVLPPSLPKHLKRQYLEAPLYPLWPENPYLLKLIRMFFLKGAPRRGATSYRRGGFAGVRGQRGYSRSRGYRGSQRGRRGRGWRRPVTSQPGPSSVAPEQRN